MPLVASTGLVRVVGVAGSPVVTQGRVIVAVAEIGDGADVTVTESLLPESVVESSGADSVTPEPAGAVNLAESDRIVSVAESSGADSVTPEPAGAVNLAESDRIVSVAEPSPSVLVEEPL